MTSYPLYQNTSILRKPVVAFFADIIVTIFIKTMFNNSKKKFERVIKVQFISAFLQIAKFILIIDEKLLISAKVSGFFTWFIYFLVLIYVTYNCQVSSFALLAPLRWWAAPENPILSRVKMLSHHKAFSKTKLKIWPTKLIFVGYIHAQSFEF